MICSWLVARQVWAGERLRFAGQLGGLTFCLDPGSAWDRFWLDRGHALVFYRGLFLGLYGG